MLSFSTLGCTDLELEEALALARGNSVNAIELRGLGGNLDLPSYFEARFGSPARLADCVADHGCAVVAMDTSVRIIGAGAVEQRELSAMLPWAQAVDVPAIRVFDGGENGDSAELATIGPVLDWWQEESATTALMIETHDCLADPEVLQRCLELYPEASFLWDTHHTWRKGGESPALTWERLRGRSIHLHVKDSILTAGVQNYVVPGEGQFPHAELIDTLTADDFSGVLSLEWERHWYPDLPPIDAPLAGFLSVYGALREPQVLPHE